MPARGPIHIETVRGTPITVGEVDLVPEVRRIVLGRREARIGREGFGAHGWALVLLSPKAVIEQRGGHATRIAIPDPTAQALTAMVALGLALSVLCILVEVVTRSLLSRERDGGRHGAQPLV